MGRWRMVLLIGALGAAAAPGGAGEYPRFAGLPATIGGQKDLPRAGREVDAGTAAVGGGVVLELAVQSLELALDG